MKIAIAQLNPTIGALAHNADQILAAAQTAVKAGARLMLTPELSLVGYPPRDLLMNPGFIDAIATQLAELAQALPPKLAVLVGTVEHNERSPDVGQKPLFNSMAWLEQGRVQRLFAKRLLPTYDVFDEDRYFEPGGVSNQFDLPVTTTAGDSPPAIKIGVTICEDLWNDEKFWGRRHYPDNPLADLVDQGVDLVVNLSASPYTVGKQALRESMLQHSIQRYQVPVIYVNQIGGNDDLVFDGSSMALNRLGEVVCRARGFATDVVLLEFELEQQDLRSLPETPPLVPLPSCPEAEIWSALVLGVKDYAQKCGFRKIVLGLSGGIDSSIVAAIAAAAVGPENVLGVLMPSPYSSDHSISDALDLAKNLGIQTTKLPIQSVMQGFDQSLDDLFQGTEPGVAEENLQSRIRGVLLMAIANKFGHLLISTGNKSEMAVGYCTLYGDMDGGLAAIADVPKTQVYKLCRWLNQQAQPMATTVVDSVAHLPIPPAPQAYQRSEIIPTHVLKKPPSAELKPDQVDQDSLPDYEILDDILDRFIHHHQSQAQIVEAGHAADVVARIVKLVTRAEFKRKQAPPGLKITDRAFGTGWRMPIARG